MSEFFNELKKGLDEAIAIERGELDSRIAVTNSIVQGFITKGRNEVIRKILEAQLVTPEQIAEILQLSVTEVKKIAKNVPVEA